MNTILFNKEAEGWEEATPIGNGFLGGMVFGRTNIERIQINEDSVWSGGKMERTNNDSKDNFKKVQDLLLSGEISKAELLAKQTMFPTYPHMRHYQVLGDIWIDFYSRNQKKQIKKLSNGLLDIVYDSPKIENYERKLRIDKAIGNIEYDYKKNRYKTEFFASNPNNILVYKIESDNNNISCDISITRKDNRSGRGSSFCDGTMIIEDYIRMFGQQGGSDGIRFEVLIDVKTKGGKKLARGSHIIVEDAKEVTLYVTARTSYRDDNPLDWCLNNIKRINSISYNQIKKNHIDDYKLLFTKSSVDIIQDNNTSNISINERIKNFKVNRSDLSLINTFYNFGRYLFISSSREGSLPLNLQGIWNEDFEPVWGSKYTININTQMNYWLAEKTGLSNLHLPLLEHIKKMYPNGKKVAKSMYGIDGFCCHHNTDIWGDCAPQDNHMSSTLWPMGGAWLCLHIIEHYKFTNDNKFIYEYINIIEDAIRFLISNLVLDKNDEYIFGPSSSPENIYINEKNEIGCLCMGSTMDSQIIRDLVEGYKFICNKLNYYNKDLENLDEILCKLAKTKIGKHKQIQEWNIDYDEVEPGHRHMSQLFGLFPSNQIRIDKNPDLACAAKNTIERRLKYGGGHTGWSKAWIVLFYARLWEGQKSWENLKDLIANNTLPNLFTTHPPFQIDGNFGGCTGLLEMLIQDYEDIVYLLPSISTELKKGKVRGVNLKAGVTIDFEWENYKINKFKAIASRKCDLSIRFNDKEIRLNLLKNQDYNYKI